MKGNKMKVIKVLNEVASELEIRGTKRISSKKSRGS